MRVNAVQHAYVKGPRAHLREGSLFPSHSGRHILRPMRTPVGIAGPLTDASPAPSGAPRRTVTGVPLRTWHSGKHDDPRSTRSLHSPHRPLRDRAQPPVGVAHVPVLVRGAGRHAH